MTFVGSKDGASADDALSVSGQYHVASRRELRLASGEALQLACGQSKITLFPDRILIESPEIQVQAPKRIALVQGDPPEATLTLQGSAALGGGTTSIVGGGKGGGKLFLDAEAHLDGALVKLNCGPQGGAGGSIVRLGEPTGKVRFHLPKESCPPGVRVATLVIATPTGETVERACEVGGFVELEGREGDVFSVVEARVDGSPVSIQRDGATPEKG